MTKRISKRLAGRLVSVCIIGDSHVAALKRAWTVIDEDYPSIKITFFASPALALDSMVVDNVTLHSPNEEVSKALEFVSGGKRRIDPDEYDVLLVYGCGARATFRSAGHFYSQAVRDKAMCDLVDGSLSFKLLTRLRTITDKPVFVGHNPFAGATKNELVSSPDAYISGIEMLNDLIYRPLGAEILMQPLTTIVNGHATGLEFSKGSRRLSIGCRFDDETHPEADNNHMNDEFGKIWLTEFLNKITA